MKIIHRHSELKQIQKTMAGKRCVYRCNQHYYGWTGFEEFGVIWPFRYFGWRVTCNIHVTVAAYGAAHRARYFDRVEKAAEELRRLMTIGRNLGQLSREPVEYFDPDAEGWPRPPLYVRAGLIDVRSSSKHQHHLSPHGPAFWRTHYHSDEAFAEMWADQLESA